MEKIGYSVKSRVDFLDLETRVEEPERPELVFEEEESEEVWLFGISACSLLRSGCAVGVEPGELPSLPDTDATGEGTEVGDSVGVGEGTDVGTAVGESVGVGEGTGEGTAVSEPEGEFSDWLFSPDSGDRV